MQSLNSDHQLTNKDGTKLPYNVSISDVEVGLTSCLLTWKEHVFLGTLTQVRTNSINIKEIASINTVPSPNSKLIVDPPVQIVRIKMMPEAATSQVIADFDNNGRPHGETTIQHPNLFHIYAPTPAQAADLSAQLLRLTLTSCRAPATPETK
jgi:hypothetical protein